MSAPRLVIVDTHPIQYHVPLFRALAAGGDLSLKVLYALLPTPAQQGSGFGLPFAWDRPLLDGYAWEALPDRRRRPSLGRFMGNSTPGIRGALAKEQPDAALLFGWHALPLLQGLIACRSLGVPTLVRGDTHSFSRRSLAKRLLLRGLLSRYDAYLTVGRNNEAFYRAHGVPRERLFPAPNFADNAWFAARAAEERMRRGELRAAWGIPGDADCFVFAGKLIPEKRVQDLVEAAVRARARIPRLRLLIVGTGSESARVRAVAESTDVPVSWAGFLNQTEMPRAYAAADCLVLPSVSETWGIVVNEAMASGLPAIVSDRVGCAPDLVREGVTGFTYPCGDVDALAGCLCRVAGDPAGRAALGRRARDRVAHYSPEGAADGVRRAFFSVVGSRR